MWAAPLPTTWPRNSVSRPGGCGVVASLSVAKATPDGYTLLLAGFGPACLRPLIDKNVGYDPDADFTPLILIGETPKVLVAKPQARPAHRPGTWSPMPSAKAASSLSAIPAPAPWVI